MNDHTAIATALQQVSSVTNEQWQLAEQQARASVMAVLPPEPVWENYESKTVSRFPDYLSKGMLVILSVIALGAFWVSAGKQLTAIERVLHGVVSASGGRVSQIWLDGALLAALFAGELAALACSACAAIFAHRGKVAVFAFRFLAILCAGVAIGGNVMLTALYPDGSIGAFQWFITLFMPSLVLIVGYIGEMFLLDMLEHRHHASLKFNSDLAEWKSHNIDAATHPRYREFFRTWLMEQVWIRQNPQRKKLLKTFIEEMPEFAILVVEREERRHQIFTELRVEIQGDDANPTLPSVMEGYQINS